MEQIRVGLIGCGWFGNRHLDYLLTQTDVCVTALASCNPKKLKSTARKAPCAKTFLNSEDLLDPALVDAVIICVPPDAHGRLEQLAALRGIHLYIEKPLGVNRSDVMRKLEALKASGIICSVGYQQRYDIGIQRLRNTIKPEDICTIEGRWIGAMPDAAWWRDKTRSGGQVIEQSTHILDMMRFLAGEAVQVAGISVKKPDTEYTVDDYSAALIRFQSGAMATLVTGCFAHDPCAQSVGLTLAGRTLKAQLEWGGRLSFCDRGEKWDHICDKNNAARAIAAFIRAVRTQDRSEILSGYADAVNTFLLSLAVEEAFRSGTYISFA